jgi:hypothetical protein
MTCSKIFSGDLPELINEIIHYFKNDFSTLYSCILINRTWCRLTIPLLWENPFSNPNKNYQFIEIYLNEEDKKKLNEYGINIKIPLNNNKTTLFNYPNFIKSLNLREIQLCIEKWISINSNNKKYFTESMKLIYKSLFKIFINNKANLNTFKVSDIKYFNDSNIIELILQNPNFINDIKNLKLITNQYFKFLTILSNNCKSISTLYLEFNEIHDIIPIEKSIINIIESQKNLENISFVQKTFLFKQNKFHLHNSLLSLKNSNCSNTLKTIIFYNIDFKNINIIKEVFEQLNVLESIHLLYCLSLNNDFIQQIISINKPFKLKSLFLSSRFFQIESFQSLLQKSGYYLENVGFGFFTNELKQQLLELIIKYCTKVKFLELLGFNDQCIFLTFDIIDNIGENLNYLSIDNEIIKLSSIVLRELGQILPNKLEYLKLCLKINPSDFELFLKKSQNTFIKKLLIRDYTTIGSEDILPYIEKYIMKKKRVKYLAFKDDFIGRDLYESKNKVKKFELYGIKVESYHSPNIYVTFIAEMYSF